MPNPIEVLSVVGARPQFIKLAPIARALSVIDELDHRIVHTGQHYDDQMSRVFFDQLGLPEPSLNLAVGSGSHGAQTASMLSGLETCLMERRPDVVLVYGDTNSTLAATLAATKLHVPVVHIESGLRSFDRSMPEEINRIATDHCADRLYAPTPLAMQNLEHEGLAGRAVLTGDVMRDAVLAHHQIAMDSSRALERLDIGDDDFALLTLHRAANTTRETLEPLLAGLAERVENDVRILFPMHPRTRAVLGELAERLPTAMRLIEPLSYFDLLRVLSAAKLAITDSGGLQKEAAFLRTPCITLREQTEWVETVEMGVNHVVGRDLDRLRDALWSVRTGPDPFTDEVAKQMDIHFGSGDAAIHIGQDLQHWIAASHQRT